ncbi:MAG: AEC family transporter [Thermoleophilia bacterium]|nr:AEC family transporter [Thermoleophilia bacterium]
MEQIITVILPTVFAIALGYLLGKVGKPDVGTLIDVAMFIATPCLVLHSLYSSPIVVGDALRGWGATLLVMAGTFVIAWLVFGTRGKGSSALYLPIMFQNTINIPLPILYLAFGDEGVATAVLFYIPNGLLIYSLGIYMASGHKELRQGLKAVLRTPLIYAAVLGLVLNLTGAAVPDAVTTGLKLVGQAAVPLMLLILGMNIGRFKFSQIPLTITASVIRMGGGFAVGLLAVWLLGMTGLPRAIVLFEAAMPSAVFVTVLCTKYNNQPELASSIVLTTTVMAVGVIPALLYYLT